MQGVIVSNSYQDQNNFLILTPGGSVIKTNKKKILISIPDWINSFPIPSDPQPNLYPIIPKNIHDDFAEKGFHPKNVTKALYDFSSLSQKNLSNHISSFRQLYQKFNQMSHSDLKELYITLDTISDYIFHSSNLELDIKNETLCESYIISEIYEKKSTPVELFSTYLYSCSNNNRFEILNKSSKSANGILIRVIPIRLSRQFEWLSIELPNEKKYNDLSLTYLQKNLGLESLPRGQAFQNFVEKVRSATSPGFNSEFSKEDLIFISVAKQVIIENLNSNSPTLPIFQEISKSLISAGVIPNKNYLKTNAIDLLRILRIYPSNYFPRLEEWINSHPKRISMSPHYQYPWAQKLNSESLLLEKSILEHPPKKKSSSVSNSATMNHLKEISVLSKGLISPNINNSDKCENIRADVMNTVYVVDGPDAKELDDGFSIKSITDRNGNIVDYWFHVHVADPTTLLNPNHPLSLIAQQKFTSVYFPDNHYPMLPLSVISNFLGLKENGNAITFSARINSEGDICDYRVSLSKLKKIKKLKYDEVDSVADWKYIEKSGFWKSNISNSFIKTPDSNDSKIHDHEIEEIKIAQDLANKHLRFRVKNMALVPDNLSYEMKSTSEPVPFNSESKVSSQERPALYLKVQCLHESPSYNLISEAMIIAGRVAAKFCHDRSVPVPYRGQISLDYDRFNLPTVHHSLSTDTNHFYPSQNKHESVKTILDEAILSRNASGVVPLLTIKKLFPFMHPASLNSKPILHSTMGIPGIDPISPQTPTSSQMIGYLQCTSPLRRYLDMVIHWQIKAELLGNNKPHPFNAEDIKKLSQKALPTCVQSKYLMKEANNTWVNEWCRRREAIFSKKGIDPLSNPSMYQSSSNGIGLQLYDWDKSKPTYRDPKINLDNPVSNNIVYTCLIGDPTIQLVLKSGSIVLLDCYIVELGTRKSGVLVSLDKLKKLKQGDFIDVMVSNSDTYTNLLQFTTI